MTRMWKLNPKLLCDKHLLGEHKELHQAVGSILKGKSLKGHIEKGQIEVHNIRKRHNELVKEMKERGFKHESPLPKFKSYKAGKINLQFNEGDLIKRCPACKTRIKNTKPLKKIKLY